jgi:hypothetical protein
MKRILLTPVLHLAIIVVANGQSPSRGEFATNTNGLMYNDADMKVLRFVVDSLNLRFKSCDLNKTYYTYPQTKQYYVSFESVNNDLKNIIKDIESNTDFHLLISRYSSFVDNIDSGNLFIRTSSRKKEGGYTYLEGTPGSGYDDVYIDKKNTTVNKDLINNWVYDYSPKDKYSKENSLTCRYFPVQWKQQAIPEKYARLIQYVDCMIDTSAVVFLTDNYSGGWFGDENEKAGYYNLKAIADYLDKQKGEQNKNQKLKQLSEQQLRFASEKLKEDAEFKTIVSKTIDDYVQNKTANFQLEQLASDLRLFDKALLMKRCYRIMGSCSQDTRPREHARDIAILAAQSHSWDIFLRAHLDIMNDRFERASDGSYAWNERKTYLKELEELNLNIVDLMLGLTLRAQNVADNHYYGTIWRMGWALTESKEKNIFEEKAIAMMKDESLDEFNRGLVFLLYKTYTSYLNETEGKQKRDILRNDISSFPGFIQASIKQLEEPKSKRR